MAFAKKHEQLGVDVDCDGYPLERTVGTVAVLVDDVSDLGESPRATDGDGESQEHLVALDRVEVVDDPAVDRDHLNDLVVDDDPAVAVEDAAPRCLFVDLFEHVGLGPLLEFLALSLESLQVPQPGDEPAEQNEGDEGKTAFGGRRRSSTINLRSERPRHDRSGDRREHGIGRANDEGDYDQIGGDQAALPTSRRAAHSRSRWRHCRRRPHRQAGSECRGTVPH